jgi:hypothetical protein
MSHLIKTVMVPKPPTGPSAKSMRHRVDAPSGRTRFGVAPWRYFDQGSILKVSTMQKPEN